MKKVKIIAEQCFGGCYSLQTALFDSVEVIEQKAFAECHSLSSVHLPNVR